MTDHKTLSMYHEDRRISERLSGVHSFYHKYR